MGIENSIKNFEGISLSQINKVELMNRCDRKFWFNIDHLEELLHAIEDDYYLLEINSERCMPYSTTYYDTPENGMYINHHRGKLNRYKIRRRCYLSTGSSFLEVKFKNNKGRTIKERISAPYSNQPLDEQEAAFVNVKSPYLADVLQASLKSDFNRLMLVSKSMDERCTIDLGLTFTSGGVKACLERLVVVEVKTEGRARSRIIDAMRRLRLKPSGFSKYCIGRSVTDSGLKHNSFKLKHRLIEREIHQSLSEILIKV